MAKRYYDGKGGMINNAHNDFANMPQDVKHVSYPKGQYGLDGMYRDTREGIDDYARENNSKIMKQKRSPSTAY